MSNVRTRFAPSPTGFVHVGSLYSALFSYAFAKKNNGQFVVRLEDTDRTRYVPGAEEALFEALEWAGLEVDESVQNPPAGGGEKGPYKQSERLDLYKKYAQELVEKGKAYYAFDTPEELAQMRKDQQEKGENPRYDRRALKLSEEEVKNKLESGEPYVIRLKVPEDRDITFTDLVRGDITVSSNDIDDQVLLKSDGYPTYHLAVVVDDHLMEISHVIRAEEWISSTPKHVLLYEAFGWEIPQHAHIPLIRNEDKSKMSKRHGHADLRWYKDGGYLPEALVNYLCLLGWSHPEEKEQFSMDEFIKEFSFERMKTTAPIFDVEKLTWLNGEYIRGLKVEDLAKILIKFDDSLNDIDEEYFLKVLTLEQERLHTLAEFVEKASFFFMQELDYTEEVLVQKGRDNESTLNVLKKSLEIVEGASSWTADDLEKDFEELLTSYEDWKKRELLMTVRGAISAHTATPPLFDTLEVLGKDQVIERIKKAIEFLG